MNARFLRFLSPAEQAKAIVEDNLFALLDDVVGVTESRLSGRHIDLDRKEVEEAYNQAWQGVYEKIAKGEEVKNLTGLLVDITYKRSLDIYRQRREAMHTDESLENHPATGDMAEHADDRDQLAGLFDRLKDRLNTNERKAITLCVLHGFSRAEAAKVLEMPEPTFQRIIDSAWKKVASVTASLHARGCGDDEWARALRSFAFGLIDEDHRDYPKVSTHVETCESCRRYVQGLRGLAAVMPPFGLRFIPLHHHPGFLHITIRSVRRLFGGHGAAAAGGAGGSGAGAAASAGTIKVAAVVVGLAVAGGAAIKVATDEHTHRHHRRAHMPAAVVASPPVVSALPAPSAGIPAIANTPKHRNAQRRGRHAHPRTNYTPPSPTQTHAIQEFGVERAHPATAAQPATPAPSPAARSAARESEYDTDFSFERKG